VNFESHEPQAPVCSRKHRDQPVSVILRDGYNPDLLQIDSMFLMQHRSFAREGLDPQSAQPELRKGSLRPRWAVASRIAWRPRNRQCSAILPVNRGPSQLQRRMNATVPAVAHAA
jgi:hypothetical protein